MCFAAGEWGELDWSRVDTAGFLVLGRERKGHGFVFPFGQGPIWKDRSSARRRKGRTQSTASAPSRQVPSRTCLPPMGRWTVSG